MKLESLQKLAASRNVSTNRDLFTSMDLTLCISDCKTLVAAEKC